MKTGIKAKKILLPNVSDMERWASIACDQFTSEEEYWKELYDFVGDAPSASKLVYPEVYLEDDTDNRIAKINAEMKKYIEDGVFNQLPEGIILTVRKTPFVERRIGIIASVDLEHYDYKVGEKPLVRATEGTITERIPPRLKIRKDALIEFPHIMVLFDDDKREIAEELYAKRDTLKKVYDFNLNMGGGKIEGYFIEDYKPVLEKFEALLNEDTLVRKYGVADRFQFAVGDGNHSLATAKAHWNNVKATIPESEWENHPARYCLAEFVNIYDEGIYFEPIFRFVTGVDREEFVNGLKEVDGNYTVIGLDKIEKKSNCTLPETIKGVDGYIKEYIEKKGGKVDYVHGEKNLEDLVEKENGIGVFLPKMDKSELFKFVSARGALPRKTFSMGEAVEKRYYLEGSYLVK